METPVAEKPKAGLVGPAIRVGVLHAALWAGMFAFLIWRVPEYKQMFMDGEFNLPSLTSTVLDVSDVVKAHAFWFAPLFLIVAGGGVAVLFYVLGRSVNSIVAWAWFLFAFLVQVLCAAALYVAVVLPIMGAPLEIQ